MKIYLAASAPGTEPERTLSLAIKTRLLSYHHIKMKQFAIDQIFYKLIGGKKNGN